MAKEGKVLEQKKLLQPLLGTPEGIHSGCIIIFSTSASSAVYPTVHLHQHQTKSTQSAPKGLKDIQLNIGCNDTPNRLLQTQQHCEAKSIKDRMQNSLQPT